MPAYVTYERSRRRASLAPARDSGSSRDSARFSSPRNDAGFRLVARALRAREWHRWGTGPQVRCALTSGMGSVEALRFTCALASGSGGVKALRFALAGLVLLGMAACGKLGGGGNDEMTWARAALERNGHLEVVAADLQTNTFTVRIKDTGELRMVRTDQIVGDPPGVRGAAGAGPARSEATAPATSQSALSDANAPAATASNSQSAGAEDQSGAAKAPGTPAAATAAPGTMRPDTPGSAAHNLARTGFPSEPVPTSGVSDPNSDVASITPGGRTLESGPGYAIKVASKPAAGTSRPEREGTAKTSAGVEHRYEPIVCQGDRLLHIDNRNLEFEGDAVSAQDGCEIHITNSHITAGGVGVSARRANVHIDNSQIEGGSASIDAAEGAQVYASASRFKGMSRRLDNSSFHDLGGNVWN